MPMTDLKDSKLVGADIRRKLNHPVVDSDGHINETSFAVLDFFSRSAVRKLPRATKTS